MRDKIETGEGSERIFGVPVLGGLLGGLVAYVAGYLAFLGFVAGTGDGLDFDDLVGSLKGTGHFFYNSFQVPTLTRLTTITEQGAENASAGEKVTVREVADIRFNPLTDSSREIHRQVYIEDTLHRDNTWTEPVSDVSLTFPAWVYLAVPVIVLFAVGFVLAYRYVELDDVGGAGAVVRRAIVGGGTVTIGFLLVALLGTYVLPIESEATMVRPDRLDTIIFGTLYGAVWSTAGVVVGQLFRREDVGTGVEPDDVTDSERPDDAGTEIDDAGPDADESEVDDAGPDADES